MAFMCKNGNYFWLFSFSWIFTDQYLVLLFELFHYCYVLTKCQNTSECCGIQLLYKIHGKRSLCAALFSRCMLNTVDGPSDTVEDYLCDPEEMPLGARKCTLPCPEDCVISEWGAWSRCSLVRSRSIL